ncbi:MAG: DegT/DnrJ/EryC1/StrS family aminotransferase [Candidatus Woykebacteria bacterium]
MIRLAWPDVKYEDVKNDFKEIVDSGQLTRGKFVKSFEEGLARYIGTKFAVATTSATTSLHLSLAVLGVKEGDEVLVSDFTHPATGNVVIEVGAKPVLVDINPEDFCLDFEDLKKKITSRTKAIIPVHPFGYPVNMEKLMLIAREKGLYVIEDAATAIGASINGKLCGAWGNLGCFSFHPRKTLTTGEGGLITTDDKNYADAALELRNHGGRLEGKNHVFTFRKAGFNYRMTEMQAALGLSQINRLEQIIVKLEEFAQVYIEKLRSFSYLDLPKVPTYGKRVFQSFVVTLDPALDRDKIIEKMAEKGIETTIGTYALHAQAAYESLGYKSGDLKNSFNAFRQTLALPLHNHLTIKDIEYIVGSLKEAVNEQR